MMLITTLVISFCKYGGGSVNVNLWFLVVYVQCEVLCCLVVAGNKELHTEHTPLRTINLH